METPPPLVRLPNRANKAPPVPTTCTCADPGAAAGRPVGPWERAPLSTDPQKTLPAPKSIFLSCDAKTETDKSIKAGGSPPHKVKAQRLNSVSAGVPRLLSHWSELAQLQSKEPVQLPLLLSIEPTLQLLRASLAPTWVSLSRNIQRVSSGGALGPEFTRDASCAALQCKG